MSKGNLKLLIIILVIAVIVTFGIFYFFQPTNSPTDKIVGTNFLSELFPFGKSKTITSSTPLATDVSDFQSDLIPEETQTKLTKVSGFPIAGFGIFMKERFIEVPEVIPTPATLTGADEQALINPATPTKPTVPETEFTTAVRYVERATGNIYQTLAEKIEERKFTNTIIPAVYDAYFGNNGETVAMRYLKPNQKVIESFAGTLPKEILGGDTTLDNQIKGAFLPENVTDISVSPDGKKIFYLFNFGSYSVGITLDPLTGKRSQIFSSPFTEWLSSWSNKNMITLTTKPSANVPGYMYVINPDKKDFNKILGNINGLTTLLSPDGKLVLYSNNELFLSIFDLNNGSFRQTGLKTLPEKCVWNKTSDYLYCAVPKFISGTNYPDTWYQGEVSFSDDIWKINITTGDTTMILDPITVENREEVDAIKLALDESENYLFFINKKDSYLWEYNLK